SHCRRVVKIDDTVIISPKRTKYENTSLLDIVTAYPKESTALVASLFSDSQEGGLEMTDKKCALRPALWALALAGGLGAFAVGTRMTAAEEQKPFYTAGAAGARTWDFDHDRGYSVPQDWTVVAGDWRVLIDADAPSEPNTLGVPGYGLPHTT